jgi:hypothetical protein
VTHTGHRRSDYDPCLEVSPAAFIVLGLAVRAFRPQGDRSLAGMVKMSEAEVDRAVRQISRAGQRTPASPLFAGSSKKAE